MWVGDSECFGSACPRMFKTFMLKKQGTRQWQVLPSMQAACACGHCLIFCLACAYVCIVVPILGNSKAGKTEVRVKYCKSLMTVSEFAELGNPKQVYPHLARRKAELEQH
jgi:hypothetical protein